MTGRDLIIYILKNGLEDKEIFKDGKINGFLTLEEAAAKLNVGTATVLLWYALGRLKGFTLLDKIYFPKDIKIPENKGEKDERSRQR